MGDLLAKQLLSVLGEAETSNNLPNSRGNLINHSFLWVQSLSPEDPPKGGHDNPLQYSCLENSHGQRRLVGYSP